MTAAEPTPSLRGRAVRGVAWTAAERWLVRLAGLATFIVLGRLLQPEEFGVVGLASSIIVLIQVVTEVGFSTWLIQATEMTEDDLSTAFWTGLALALAIAGALFGLAGPLAGLLGAPQMDDVLRALSVVLVLGGVGSVPTAMLTRELRFRELALRQVASVLVGSAVGITAAVLGAGVWALVAQAVTLAFVQTIVLYLTSRWRPKWIWRRRSAREMTSVGGKAIGVGMLQQIRDQGEFLLIGGLLGVTALGYWSIAMRLYGVLIDVGLSIVTTVATPVFVKMREDRSRMGRAYRVALTGAALVVGPAMTALAVLSPYVVPLVFGRQWQASVPVAGVLAVGGVLAVSSFFDRPVFLAAQRLGAQLTLMVFTVALHLALVPLVGLPLGLTALAISVALSNLVIWPVRLFVLRRVCGMPVSSQADGLRILASCLLAGALVEAGRRLVNPSVNWVDFVVVTVVFSIVLAGTLWLTSRGLVMAFIRGVRPGGVPDTGHEATADR